MIISIIIPVYKVEKYITKTLISVCNQDIDNYEIIIVNDGSPDNSLSACEIFAAESSRNIKIISQENGGLSKARNTGLFHAIGKYVWFIDSDDWIEENCLGRIVSLLTDGIDELVIGGDNVTDVYYKFLSNRNLFPKYHLQTLSGIETWKKGIAQKSAAVFAIYRRQFLLDNNLCFYEGIFHEDNEFCPKASYLSNATRYLSEVIYHVRQNPMSITRTLNPKKAYDNILVAQRLSIFCKEYVNEDLKILFYQYVSLLINNAFYEVAKSNVSEIKKFEIYFLKADILPMLLKSMKLKYIVEWILIKVFHKPISVYVFLKH